MRGDANLSTLLDYTYRDRWTAERGQHGMGSNKTGRSGADTILPVPPGTVIKDDASGAVIAEVLRDGEELIVARGGRGGRGNSFFATATHQSPREWQPGEEGESRTLLLELKLIADVGLVGEPNAGKSTLLSVISAARPRIADYPFTTLTPNLGVVQMSDRRSFVVADIPGIIEGAHRGKGLGLQFLRHVERTRLLAFLIPVDSADAQAEFDRLRVEVESYSESLARKPYCVIFSKMDLAAGEGPPAITSPGAAAVYEVSAAARSGLQQLVNGLWSQLARLRNPPEEDQPETHAP